MGCQSEKKVGDKWAFFPPAPNKPRLQFLTSYTTAEDVGYKRSAFLEDFVLGAPEQRDLVGKPYGLDVYDGKIYVCDVGRQKLERLDITNKKFEYLDGGGRMKTPTNLFIDANGTKYVADPVAQAVFVFNRDDKLVKILGQDMDIGPVDIYVRGGKCYVTDSENQQVVVLDIKSNTIENRIGGEDDFTMITGITLDKDGNIYATDKFAGRITKFDAAGNFIGRLGRLGDSQGSLVRPKGIEIDREGRIWVVDAGPAEAVKIYTSEWRFLMLFGRTNPAKGMMSMPVGIKIDYDNVDLFKKYVVPGADLEFVVFVTSQFSDYKVNVYGFCQFPAEVIKAQEEKGLLLEESGQESEPGTEGAEIPLSSKAAPAG